MGGNALKNTYTERATPRHYLNVYNQVVCKLQNRYPNVVFYLPRGLRHKEDHGDLDLLVRSDTVPNLGPMEVREIFGPNEVVSNGGVYSFDVMDLQVDLIKKSKENWGMSRVFFDMPFLGNAMGKLARFLHFKFGFQGLRYCAYAKNRSVKLGEYTLTKDPREAFEFLGFDYDPFLEGFETLEDMFEYVRRSTYFNYECFQPESLNAGQRHRDTKRTSYALFMKWLEELSHKPTTPRPSRQEAVEMAEKAFPMANLREKMERDREQLRRRDEANKVFNGKTAMDHFDLQGKELGVAMGKFRSQFDSKEEYTDYRLERSTEELLEEFAQMNELNYEN